MRAALIQMPVTADKSENLETACLRLREAKARGADIAVLPEMFCCPYDNACFRSYGETQGGEVQRALSALADPAAFNAKYGTQGQPVMLFAVGDGNHSLATAKACYERRKGLTDPGQWPELPSRYALCELVNLHDDSLEFEPIHRVAFGVKPEELLDALMHHYPSATRGKGEGHVLSFVINRWSQGEVTVGEPSAQLPVGTLQNFLDAYLKENGGEVDYIHGDKVTDDLGAKPGNIGFKLPAMGKDQLFKTVIADGVLPRKTFSMGHAEDKRYYVEGRKIK